MKKIGFIGAYEKTDLILYMAKILTLMGEKVLVVDTTLEQRAKYIVPTVSLLPSYITSYEEIDVAVGLYSFEEIANYLGQPMFDENQYTYVLFDIDNAKYVETFNAYSNEKNYFVTSFDLYSLKKGVEILKKISQPLELTKVLFSKDMTAEEDEYLNYLSLETRAEWSEERIYFPFDNGDNSIIAENQRFERIKIKGLSKQYKDALIYVMEQIAESNTIKRIVRQLEKNSDE